MLGLAVALSQGRSATHLQIRNLDLLKRRTPMTQTTGTQRGSEQTGDKTAIRPFQVKVPENGTYRSAQTRKGDEVA